MERRIRALLMARAERGSRMTHLPYIVAAYALGVLIPASFARGGVPAHARGAAPARRRSTRRRRAR